ncbi:hypothetical protein CONPUDRAFT_142807 [Coniophora puteana RWD-64-598 SS2]|uniref:Uncharacterized protein n=1 Tax=Coniophora puteana (strain RWD-64-598) TaxID=741705 RepID=A0A5M3MZN2_CONPW|nr:uncharacterized protein CONPUDRAFT_142807 [Coniophora puteana RWD-64-598 SS2]EIW84589.1 hypothetical protein CONPUDRAFT_142807 [Coniophora puteana RWD-64-598 SS2]
MPTGTGKREREEDTAPVDSLSQTGQSESGPRAIAGSSRVAGKGGIQQLPQSTHLPPVSLNQDAPAVYSQMQPQQRTHQQLTQLPMYDQMSSDAAASSVLHPPQSQHALHLNGLDPFQAWLSGEISSLDLPSVMMAYDGSYIGAAESGGFSMHEFAADTAYVNAAPHMPYRIEDFLFHLMQSQQQLPGAEAEGTTVAGVESMDMDRMMMASQPTSSDGMLSMWSNASNGFEVDSWRAYLNSVSGTNYNNGTQPQDHGS